MNLLAVIMIFIGLNIDTFIALLFVLRNYNYRLPIITFVTATITLWILGVVLGKGLAALFPDWITGFMGIVLIFLAVFGQNDDDNENINTGFISLFLFCLSLGGDNLAVYIPWGGKFIVAGNTPNWNNFYNLFSYPYLIRESNYFIRSDCRIIRKIW